MLLRPLLAVILAFAPVAAQAQPVGDGSFQAEIRRSMARADDPMPANKAELDRLYEAGQRHEFLAVIAQVNSSDEVLRILNWERAKVFEGGDLVMANLYARDLWGVSAGLKGAQQATIRASALVMGLYAYALIEVDGARCADPEAGPSRKAHHATAYADLWRWAAAAKPEVRIQAIEAAQLIEMATAPVRKPDEPLCQGAPKDELTEIVKGLEALGDQKPPLAAKQDKLGTTYEVPRAPAKFLTSDEAAPKQAAVRSNLPALLTGWLAQTAR